MSKVLFHLAFPVIDIPSTKAFYVDGLGCLAGRESNSSLILSLYGHQLVAHVVNELPNNQTCIYPRHFGLVFQSESSWLALLEKVHDKRLKFYQQPKIRFADTPLEHRTFFLTDLSGNILEFKHYKFESAIFGETAFHQVGDLAVTQVPTVQHIY
ncbi:putative dioxygenase of extradiol dioxygenase family [Synechococcus sp. PCC 7502]|uniref:VOC family protein n=1 Tax=Synechococcus sp. PCC 7502 TaxID=1173263 RepID=UPI00029FDE6E|nr:VOC family protein [Synechococcus sp. PCC 7502]AFY74693.1 putative dioxygenase of extradiol dioxygenase family [Synechococcus sp. PCC 7502]